MNLKDLYKIINNKYSNLTPDEKNMHFINELKKAINNNISIKVTEEDINYIISLNYRYNKKLLDDEIYKLIKKNNLDELKILTYLEK